jgi:hypothetical protein
VRRFESRLLRAAQFGVAATGLAWGWMLWFAEPDDPYSTAGHPWQPQMHAAHVLLAPALILAIGLIWREHAWARLRSGFRPRRRSGAALALLFLPMAASGYLLQVAVAERARELWTWVHVAASLLWIGAWIAHRWPRRDGALTAGSA